MKEALITGAAVFLLSYLFVTALIKISRAIDRYKMKKKTDKIKVGQRYEYKGYFTDPFERGKHVIKILDLIHTKQHSQSILSRYFVFFE